MLEKTHHHRITFCPTARVRFVARDGPMRSRSPPEANAHRRVWRSGTAAWNTPGERCKSLYALFGASLHPHAQPRVMPFVRDDKVDRSTVDLELPPVAGHSHSECSVFGVGQVVGWRLSNQSCRSVWRQPLARVVGGPRRMGDGNDPSRTRRQMVVLLRLVSYVPSACLRILMCSSDTLGPGLADASAGSWSDQQGEPVAAAAVTVGARLFDGSDVSGC